MKGNVMQYFKPGEQIRMMCYSHFLSLRICHLLTFQSWQYAGCLSHEPSLWTEGRGAVLGGGSPSLTQLTPTPAPLGSLDTLPRSPSLLQTKMAEAPSKRTSLETPTEK